MPTYRVDDMSCSLCAQAITRAVRTLDTKATLQFEMRQRLVSILHTTTEPKRLYAAILLAGYTPVPCAPPQPMR